MSPAVCITQILLTRCQNLTFSFSKIFLGTKRFSFFCLICRCWGIPSDFSRWYFEPNLDLVKQSKFLLEIFLCASAFHLSETLTMALGINKSSRKPQRGLWHERKAIHTYKHTDAERDTLANLLLVKELQQYSGEFSEILFSFGEKKKVRSKIFLNKLKENFSIFYLVLKLQEVHF